MRFQKARVVTVERNEERYQKAQEFIERAGKQDKIVSLFGDALELRDEIERHGPYDAVFIDAAKGQYQRFFEHYEPMLSSKGMIISDNVLFKGHVATDLAEVETRRRRSLIKKIQAYNTWLMNHPDYYTTILLLETESRLVLKEVTKNEKTRTISDTNCSFGNRIICYKLEQQLLWLVNSATVCV